jgi:hypothetical protein
MVFGGLEITFSLVVASSIVIKNISSILKIERKTASILCKQKIADRD